ncbi:MAG: hypothetical protein ACH255_11905 [Candidatus Thiodiazotropha sp.]
MNCLICEKPIEYAGQGRPPAYCGKLCRRAAEYEIRRIQRRLTKLETRLSELQAEPYTWAAEFGIPKLKKQIQSVNERLLQLLGANNE